MQSNLGDLGLLHRLWFPSRLLPVYLVPVDPAPQFISQPGGETDKRVRLVCKLRSYTNQINVSRHPKLSSNAATEC